MLLLLGVTPSDRQIGTTQGAHHPQEVHISNAWFMGQPTHADHLGCCPSRSIRGISSSVSAALLMVTARSEPFHQTKSFILSMTHPNGKKTHLISLHSGFQCRHNSKHNFSKLSLQFSTKTVFCCVLCWDQHVGWELGERSPWLSPLPPLPAPHTSHIHNSFARGCQVRLLTCELLTCCLGH